MIWIYRYIWNIAILNIRGTDGWPEAFFFKITSWEAEELLYWLDLDTENKAK